MRLDWSPRYQALVVAGALLAGGLFARLGATDGLTPGGVLAAAVPAAAVGALWYVGARARERARRQEPPRPHRSQPPRR